MSDPQAAHYIRQLQDADWSVRKSAVLALGKLDDPAVLPALVLGLQDVFASVRAFAAIELGKRGEASVVPNLIAALQDEEWIVRKNAVRALVKIGEPSAVPALIERLQDEDGGTRGLVAWELGKMGEIAAIPTLIEMLQDKDETVQARVTTILINIGVPAVGALLQYLAYPSVQKLVARVLWNIGNATTLPRKILAERRLSARDRIIVLDNLRRARPDGLTFYYKFAPTRDLCLAVLKEEDAEARAGAQTVLNWLDGDRHLVHASQSEDDFQELVRASLGEASEIPPETLLRGTDEPQKNAEQPPSLRSPWQRLFGKRKHSGRD